MNSATFNGNDMPAEMKKVLPEVFKKDSRWSKGLTADLLK